MASPRHSLKGLWLSLCPNLLCRIAAWLIHLQQQRAVEHGYAVMSSEPIKRAELWSAWVHVVQRLAFLTCRLLIQSYSSTAAVRVSVAPWMASASVGAMRRSLRVDWVISLLRNTTVVALMLACRACWSLFVWRWSGPRPPSSLKRKILLMYIKVAIPLPYNPKSSPCPLHGCLSAWMGLQKVDASDSWSAPFSWPRLKVCLAHGC